MSTTVRRTTAADMSNPALSACVDLRAITAAREDLRPYVATHSVAVPALQQWLSQGCPLSRPPRSPQRTPAAEAFG